MRFLSPRNSYPINSYLLAVPVTALMTWSLLLVQSFVAHIEGGHVRPFGSGFLLIVAVMTILGGRGPGVFTLALSTLVLAFYLTPLGTGGLTGRPRDLIEIVLLLTVGGALIRGFEAMRANALLLAESEEARGRLRAIMDTAPVGVVLSDPKGSLLYANLEAERIWGQTLESIRRQGDADYEIFHPDGTPAPPSSTGLRRALAGEPGVMHVDVLVEHPDKTRIYVESDSTVVKDKTGRVTSGLVIFADVTERKKTEEEVRRLLARERLVSRIGQISLQTLDPDIIQREAADGLAELLGADRVFFILHDGETKLHVPGQTLVVPDAAVLLIGEAASEIMTAEKVRAAIITPLFDGRRLMATLNVAMVTAPRDWEPGEVSLVEAVAVQTRAALEAARAQKREHAIAVALQDALLPSLPKRVPGLAMASYYKAALLEASVGGDFLDVFALEDGQAVFAVGDLSGKGLAAASQVATIRNMLRYSLYRTASLEQAITELNRTIVAHDLLTGFATLFVGVYNARSRTLTYLSCGHDPGLLRRAADGGGMVLLPAGGTEVNAVLGLTEDSVFQHQSIKLADGDTLFFCTDGVTEAGRNRGEFLGVAGVAALLQAGLPGETPEELVARMVSGVRDYALGEMHDDVCLLAAVVGE